MTTITTNSMHSRATPIYSLTEQQKTLQHWSGVGGASQKESEVKFSPGLNELSLQIYYTLPPHTQTALQERPTKRCCWCRHTLLVRPSKRQACLISDTMVLEMDRTRQGRTFLLWSRVAKQRIGSNTGHCVRTCIPINFSEPWIPKIHLPPI